MEKSLRSIATVASSTLGSRILGLLRDVLVGMFLGRSAVASIFWFAFTIPNLFRRLLGEGALTSAFVPVLSEEHEAQGRSGAFVFVNEVLCWAGLVLFVLVCSGALFFKLLSVGLLEGMLPFWGDSVAGMRWGQGLAMGAFLLPYMLLICLAAVFSAALNVLGRFAAPALSPVLLNLAMIAALVLGGVLWELEMAGIAWVLGAGVLLGGLLQLLLPAIVLWREGWRPAWAFRRSSRLEQALQLFIPGLFGAAIIQINNLVSRVVAFDLNDTAVASLYYANRLVELPLGVFAIAVTTVLFPQLSQCMARGDQRGMKVAYLQGIRLIAMITVPAAIGLIVLSQPILSLLFQWGHFGANDVAAVVPLLIVFSLSLPAYALSTYATRGFHAMQDTRTPVRIAFYTFVLNLVFSISFMLLWGTLGLALASFLSSAYQAVALQYSLQKRRALLEGSIVQAVFKILVAALVMSVAAYFIAGGINSLSGAGKLSDFFAVVVTIPLSALLYFIVLWLLGIEEVRNLKSIKRSFTQ